MLSAFKICHLHVILHVSLVQIQKMVSAFQKLSSALQTILFAVFQIPIVVLSPGADPVTRAQSHHA